MAFSGPVYPSSLFKFNGKRGEGFFLLQRDFTGCFRAAQIFLAKYRACALQLQYGPDIKAAAKKMKLKMDFPDALKAADEQEKPVAAEHNHSDSPKAPTTDQT